MTGSQVMAFILHHNGCNTSLIASVNNTSILLLIPSCYYPSIYAQIETVREHKIARYTHRHVLNQKIDQSPLILQNPQKLMLVIVLIVSILLSL